VLTNLLFDVYWRDWSAAAIEDMVSLAKATLLVVVALLAFNFATNAHWIPTGAVLAGGSLSLVVEAALHLRPRWAQIARAALGRSMAANNLIVVGADRLGQLFAADIAAGGRDYRIACFVDDNPRRLGTWVRGVRVAGRLQDLSLLIDWYRPTTVVIAMDEPPGGLIRRVVDLCDGKDVRIRRVNGFSLLHGDNSPLRPIAIDELLAREPVDLTGSATQEHYGGKRILVTGAAGSIGSELVRQLAGLSPEHLYLLDTNESGLYQVHQDVGGDRLATIVLGDVRDANWLSQAFRAIKPQVIFHAAAYKHVPILEGSPLAGLSTNVIGTSNVVRAATTISVERLVFVSTDKAVEPTSVLGFTKRFGELYTLAVAERVASEYSVVRFGNVLGSVGSAVPLFTSQIDRGGPVTVTHIEATRYFMTIQEAVGLLIEAGALATTADMLVLDMGEPVSIAELARRMVKLRGLRTPEDIQITYVGLRPGEKLHETLTAASEQVVGTTHPRVLRVESRAITPALEVLDQALAAISDRVANQDADGALEVLLDVIGVKRPRPEAVVQAN
jgi:FlaA1/EpsC-like NDP-sugar epimerase